MKQENLNHRGITLIALIITIIVMLILISITVRIALNGGIISNTKTASSETQKIMDKEELQEKAIIEANKEGGKVDLGKLEKKLSEGWKVDKESGECVSPHGNTFFVGEDGIVDDENSKIKEDENAKSITLDKKAVTLEQGEKATVVATLENSDEVVQWKSGNTSFATVTPIDNNSAEVNYVGDGLCIVEAKTTFGSAWCGVYCGDTKVDLSPGVLTDR